MFNLPGKPRSERVSYFSDVNLSLNVFSTYISYFILLCQKYYPLQHYISIFCLYKEIQKNITTLYKERSLIFIKFRTPMHRGRTKRHLLTKIFQQNISSLYEKYYIFFRDTERRLIDGSKKVTIRLPS